MNPKYTAKAFYADEKNMTNSFGLYDEGKLEIYDKYIAFNSKKSDISIEKERIQEAGIIFKTPGIYEFIMIILANIVLVAGFLGFKQRSPILLLILLACANALLYVPLFREKWIKVIYLEAGENKTAYFKSSLPLEVFNSMISSNPKEENLLEKIREKPEDSENSVNAPQEILEGNKDETSNLESRKDTTEKQEEVQSIA